MNIILFCAIDRGLKFLLKVQEILPEVILIVISFVETPWKPKYLDNIHSVRKEFNGRFYLWDDIWEMPEYFWSELAIEIIFGVSWRYIISSKIYNKAKIGSFKFNYKKFTF